MQHKESLYKILHYLLIKESASLKSLARIGNVSEKTLRKWIDQLNQQFFDIAQVIEGYFGYQLVIKDVPTFEKMMDSRLRSETDFNSPHKRIAFMIKRLLEATDYIIIDDLADGLMISRTTANNDLKELKYLIEKFNLTIESRTNRGLKLVGLEKDIRLLLIYHVYDYFNDAFSLDDEIEDFLLKMQTIYRLDKFHFSLLVKTISVVVYRVSRGFYLTKEILGYINLEGDAQTIQELCVILENKLSCHLTKYDTDFCCFPLNTRNTSYINTRAMRLHEPIVFEWCEKIVAGIKDKLIVPFDKLEFFYHIKYHLLFMINRAVFYVDKPNILSDEIEKKYPLYFELAQISVDILERALNLAIHSSEIAYIAIYMHLTIHKQQKEKKVCIISNVGQGMLRLIYQHVREIFGQDIEIVLASEYDYQKTDYRDCLVIFTTIPIETQIDIPVIKISHIFNRDEIIKKTDNIFNRNELIVDYHQMDNAMNYHDNVVTMIKDFTHLGLLDETFLDLYEHREKKGTMFFKENVAMPHAINKKSNKIILITGICQKEENSINTVKLVFLVAIPEKMVGKTSHMLMNLYDTIFLIATNPKLYEKIIKVDSKEALMSFVKKETVLF